MSIELIVVAIIAVVLPICVFLSIDGRTAAAFELNYKRLTAMASALDARNAEQQCTIDSLRERIAELEAHASEIVMDDIKERVAELEAHSSEIVIDDIKERLTQLETTASGHEIDDIESRLTALESDDAQFTIQNLETRISVLESANDDDDLEFYAEAAS